MMKRIRSIVIWLIILLISVLVSLWWDLGSLNDAFNQTILLKVRLPRVLEAMLTGATLTIAGHMFQTILNNPLADSFTLGLASGASLGSGLALFLGLSFLWVPFFYSIQFDYTCTRTWPNSDIVTWLSYTCAHHIRFNDWCLIQCTSVYVSFN